MAKKFKTIKLSIGTLNKLGEYRNKYLPLADSPEKTIRYLVDKELVAMEKENASNENGKEILESEGTTDTIKKS